MLPMELKKKNYCNPSRFVQFILNLVILNIVNFCVFTTSLSEGNLLQALYNQRMGLLRLELVSEYRVSSNQIN